MPDKSHTDEVQELSKDASFDGYWRAMGVFYSIVAVFWVILGIIVQYFIVGISNPKEGWSGTLPDLGATTGKMLFMGLHFVTGAIITVQGAWQIWPGSRTPERVHLHRLGGRIFTVCAALTFVGGFGFILQQRILAGGILMTISFSIYGGLTAGFTVMTYVTAKAKDFEAHRRWAIRAFAMCAGSFFYRVLMNIGTATGLLPTDPAFQLPREDRSTPFFSDYLYNIVITWAFWVLSVIFVEWYLSAPSTKATRAVLNGFLVLFVLGLSMLMIGFVGQLGELL